MRGRSPPALAGAIVLSLAACVVPPRPSGLRPVEPRGTDRGAPEVGSLTPVLAWEPVSTGGPTPSWGGLPESGTVTDVAYEVRVWPIDRGVAGDPVYDRRDIASPRHIIETALQPGSEYGWSVRVWFDLDGHRRVTDWSFACPPARPGSWGPLQVSTTGAIPPECLFRFSTKRAG